MNRVREARLLERVDGCQGQAGVAGSACGPHRPADLVEGAGVHKSNPALLVPLIACAPVARTRAVTTSAGMLTHDIIIAEGKDSGCRGNIPAEVLKR